MSTEPLDWVLRKNSHGRANISKRTLARYIKLRLISTERYLGSVFCWGPDLDRINQMQDQPMAPTWHPRGTRKALTDH